MLNSRDINLLRPDVAANCRKFLKRCEAAGLPVLITGTVRDNEYQQQCYEKGTGGRPPATFHHKDYGLAFDICKNVRGQEYSDNAFWEAVGKIGQEVGFSWGFAKWGYDKPHFQWDNHGKSSHKNAPQMPLYTEGEENMTAQEVIDIVDAMLTKRIVEERNAAVDAYAKEAWEKAKTNGLLDGTMPQSPVTRQQLAVVLERAGVLK